MAGSPPSRQPSSGRNDLPASALGDVPVRYHHAHLSQLPPIDCPCGEARRAFTDVPAGTATIHHVTIRHDSQIHYHKRMTEIYYVLSGKGHLELDGNVIATGPGDAFMIEPGCRHRAVGELTILNIAIPAFDPSDEWFD